MIYFAQPTNGGAIRIGCTSNVYLRQKALGTWLPGGIEIIDQIMGDMVGEAVLINLFQPIRLDRDWFRSSKPMWRFLLSLDGRAPAWLPCREDAETPSVEQLVKEFGSLERAAPALGYNSANNLLQAVKSTSLLAFSVEAKWAAYQLLRDRRVPDYIAELHAAPVSHPDRIAS